MAAGAVRRLGQPHGADVVVDLVVGRDLDELHRAAAPLADRLDPDGGALLVLHPVLIVVEAAVALRQAEAARVLVREAGEADTRRVVEGAPDPLDRTGDRKSTRLNSSH